MKVKKFDFDSLSNWFRDNYNQDDHCLGDGMFPEDREYGIYTPGYEIGLIVDSFYGIDVLDYLDGNRLPQIEKWFPGLLDVKDLSRQTIGRLNRECEFIPYLDKYIPIFEKIIEDYTEEKPKKETLSHYLGYTATSTMKKKTTKKVTKEVKGKKSVTKTESIVGSPVKVGVVKEGVSDTTKTAKKKAKSKKVEKKVEEKTFVVPVPEGYVIDEEQSTFEKIVYKKDLPKTWDEYCKSHVKENVWSIKHGGNELEHVLICSDRSLYKTLFSSKETAVAFVALMQLIQLRDYYNDGWIPAWRKKYVKDQKDVGAIILPTYGRDSKRTFGIIDGDGYVCDEGDIRILTFKTIDLANKFLSNFEDLMLKAWELL